MSPAPNVEIFLEYQLMQNAQAGKHNFLRLVSEALVEGGLQPVFRRMSEAVDCNTAHSLIHMKAPASERGLVFRRAYHYPFWQIERTEKRGYWDVANTAFDPQTVNEVEAHNFARYWRNRLFPDVTASQGNHIYVPLQGKLLRRRSFQTISPVNMLEAILASATNPVVAALHPNEDYTRAETLALEKLAAKHTNLSVLTGEMMQHLPSCKLVVTQNSSVAFNQYFFSKPTILFAEIDFHHIAVTSKNQPFAHAMDQALSAEPEFEKYLWWFWQDQSINAGKPNAREKIRARLQKFGWPVA